MTYHNSYQPKAVPSLNGITAELQKIYSENEKWKEYVQIETSSINGVNGRDPYNLLDQSNNGNEYSDNWCSNESDPNPFLIISFKHFSIIASYYSFKLKTVDETFPTEWFLYGSKNNQTWEQINNDNLSGNPEKGEEIIYPLKEMKPYKHFKFEQVSNNAHTYHFCLRRIELFGQIYNFVLTFSKHLTFKPSVFLFILFL